MRVRVFHTDDLGSGYVSGGAGTGLREVFAYDEPDPAPDHLVLLEVVFWLFNVGDDPQLGGPDQRALDYRRHRLRSLSVGDVVALGEVFYACAPVGWQLLEQPPTIEDLPGSADDPPDAGS